MLSLLFNKVYFVRVMTYLLIKKALKHIGYQPCDRSLNDILHELMAKHIENKHHHARLRLFFSKQLPIYDLDIVK